MSKSWKDAFLSSGMPLEYEVADVLWKAGYSVDGEFPYSRKGSETPLDFSVDLSAGKSLNGGKSGPGGANIKLLCECKYRTPGKSWLFIPDNNPDDGSPSRLACLREFPTFTCCSYDSDSIARFCAEFPFVLKGMELLPSGGEAHDRDIRHALNQVRYALPSASNVIFEDFASDEPDFSPPAFLLPIIVTNAEIRILNRGLTVEMIKQSTELNEISTPSTCVNLHSEHANDFSSHCVEVFKKHSPEERSEFDSSYLNLRRTNRKFSKLSLRTPIQDLYLFRNGLGPDSGFFQQFLIVNITALPELIVKVQNAVTEAVRDSAQLVFNEPE